MKTKGPTMMRFLVQKLLPFSFVSLSLCLIMRAWAAVVHAGVNLLVIRAKEKDAQRREVLLGRLSQLCWRFGDLQGDTSLDYAQNAHTWELVAGGGVLPRKTTTTTTTRINSYVLCPATAGILSSSPCEKERKRISICVT